jgi:hypothetical protein
MCFLGFAKFLIRLSGGERRNITEKQNTHNSAFQAHAARTIVHR